MAEEETSISASNESAPSSATADGAVKAPPAMDSADDTATLRERVSELERQLAEMEQKFAAEREQATDYMNRWQRTQADFANFKRRAEQEQGQRDALTTAQVVALFLPALDSFERAFATLPPTLLGYSWIDGISLVLIQMRRALQVQGVEQMEVEPGQPFNPMRHESIGEVESTEYPEGHIAVVVQSGYEVQGRVLRPALVQLARKQAATPAAETAAEAANKTGATTESEAVAASDTSNSTESDSSDNNRADEAEGTA